MKVEEIFYKRIRASVAKDLEIAGGIVGARVQGGHEPPAKTAWRYEYLDQFLREIDFHWEKSKAEACQAEGGGK